MGCLTLPALRPRASTRPINARVVRRSLALRGLAQQVSYSECSSVGLWLRLGWVYASRGLGYFRGEPINLSPRSGEGPPSWLLEEGAFAVEVTATAASGAQAVATVAGKGDPGYGCPLRLPLSLPSRLLPHRRLSHLQARPLRCWPRWGSA